MTIRVRKLHPALGGEVTGVDLSSADERTFGDIVSALDDRSVLVFPEMDITDEQQIAFTRRFGELEVFPLAANKSSRNPEIFRATNVGEDGKLLPVQHGEAKYLALTQIWHTDSSWRPIPAYATLLRGVEIPSRGGETMFASLVAAYEALPENRKRELEGLRAVHSFEYTRSLTDGLKPLTAEERARVAPVAHPIVRKHPAGDGRVLYLSPHTMSGVVGMTEAAGRALIEELTAWATQSQFVYVHRWRRNDLVVWDNRTAMHAVRPYDSANERRVMHRTSVSARDAPAPVH